MEDTATAAASAGAAAARSNEGRDGGAEALAAAGHASANVGTRSSSLAETSGSSGRTRAVQSGRRARVDGSRKASSRGAVQYSLDWDSALAALVGSDDQRYGIRPRAIRASATRQLFVERPPVHRMAGGDKWRNSGGKRGGVDYWADEHTGVRKRYGRVLREEGRAPLKFMLFSLLHRAAEGAEELEDMSVRMYTVEATNQEEPPLEEPSGEGAPAPQQTSHRGPERAHTSTPAATIDAAEQRFGHVLRGIAPQLAAAGSSPASSSPQLQVETSDGVTTVDMGATLSFRPELCSDRIQMHHAGGPGSPALAAPGLDSDGLSSSSGYVQDFQQLWDAAEVDWANGDDSSTASGSSSAAGRSSLISPDSDNDEIMDFASFDTGSDTDWSDGPWDLPPPVGLDVPVALDVPPALPPGSAAGHWTWNPAVPAGSVPTPSAPDEEKSQKRKMSRHSDYYSSSAPIKKGRGSSRLAAAGLASFMLLTVSAVVILLSSKLSTQKPSEEFSRGVCAAQREPSDIPGGNAKPSTCAATLEGDACPYECMPGFKQQGSRLCTRQGVEKFRFTGGTCVPKTPCDDGLTLTDDAVLTLGPGDASPFSSCRWDLVCTDTSLSPALTFVSFRMANGNLTIRDVEDPLADRNVYPEEGPEKLLLAAEGWTAQGWTASPSHARRLGENRRLDRPAEQTMVLRGTDSWWISQPAIGVIQPRASVEYMHAPAAASGAANPGDFFAASFSCKPPVETCWATDRMELDWVTVRRNLTGNIPPPCTMPPPPPPPPPDGFGPTSCAPGLPNQPCEDGYRCPADTKPIERALCAACVCDYSDYARCCQPDCNRYIPPAEQLSPWKQQQQQSPTVVPLRAPNVPDWLLTRQLPEDPWGTVGCASRPCQRGVCVDSATIAAAMRNGDKATDAAAYSSTAFGFVCNCEAGWGGEKCDSNLCPSCFQPCEAAVDDCNASASTCASISGEHVCQCFPGYKSTEKSPRDSAGGGSSTSNSCQMNVQGPPGGQSWRSGPGYEATDGGFVRGTFAARVGESPRYLVASSLSQGVYFDPARYSRVLLGTPADSSGCTALAYRDSAMDLKGKVALLRSASSRLESLAESVPDDGTGEDDDDCGLWTKTWIAQAMGAVAVIIYGDHIPEGSEISWLPDKASMEKITTRDPSMIGLHDILLAGVLEGAPQFGGVGAASGLDVPVIFLSEKQGAVLRRAALSGPTWVDLHCAPRQVRKEKRFWGARFCTQ
jgi:hypothetical protein